MPCAVSNRCSQNPSRPASKQHATSTARPSLVEARDRSLVISASSVVVSPPWMRCSRDFSAPAERKLRLRRRIGLRVARARRQPTQLYPMQQPVGARQAAINLKLLLQYSLRVDRAKRHYPVPLQLGASDNPLLEPRARHRVYPWLSTRTRPITQSLYAVLFIPVMPFVSR